MQDIIQTLEQRPMSSRPHLTLLLEFKVSMAKPITLTFPEKTASELAGRLGISKARQNRIFSIVDKATGKNGTDRMIVGGKAKRKASRSAVHTSRSGRRKNAKAAR